MGFPSTGGETAACGNAKTALEPAAPSNLACDAVAASGSTGLSRDSCKEVEGPWERVLGWCCVYSEHGWNIRIGRTTSAPMMASLNAREVR